jgi:hypothetical protein
VVHRDPHQQLLHREGDEPLLPHSPGGHCQLVSPTDRGDQDIDDSQKEALRLELAGRTGETDSEPEVEEEVEDVPVIEDVPVNDAPV